MCMLHSVDYEVYHTVANPVQGNQIGAAFW